MKVEMGESLFYSWLRHVKGCQVVQTNWKASPSWQLQNEAEIKHFLNAANEHFQNQYGYGINKHSSLSQLLAQAEVDAIGLNMSGTGTEIYAIDVAFHESGLNYGDRQRTVMRVVKKFIRTALCLVGYFDVAKGDIIFAAPKIHNAIMEDLRPCVSDINAMFHTLGNKLSARVIANDDFNEQILKPILVASDSVADTSELFVRGYQLVKMFGEERLARQRTEKPTCDKVAPK